MEGGLFIGRKYEHQIKISTDLFSVGGLPRPLPVTSTLPLLL